MALPPTTPAIPAEYERRDAAKLRPAYALCAEDVRRERVEMAPHKFVVGQTVRFSPDRQQLRSGGGWFNVTRLLPEAASVLQYRIKSQLDGHERVVREDQLARS